VQRVLVLDADWTPLRVVTWQRAVVLLFEEKVTMVESYAGLAIRTASAVFPRPAVVVLGRYHGLRERVPFTRQNLLCRDDYTCQYCGVRPRRSSGKPDLAELTLDHVIPRARAVDGRVRGPQGFVGVTSWTNIVAACVACNGRKGSRTPEEAKMPLRSRPRVPSGLDRLRMAVRMESVPSEWRDWLPAGSPWRGYWTDELDAG
jgi:5-methylcytosine-specific restriction endonuclease McrA